MIGFEELSLLGSASLLLLLSAVFAGSEAAFFSLAPHDLNQLEMRGGRLDQMVVSLIRRPRPLLFTILFGNLVVNVLLFSMATVQSTALADRGAGTALVLAPQIIALTMVILVGELIPKLIGLLAPRRIAYMVAPGLVVLRFFLSPLTRPLNAMVNYVGTVVTGRREASPALSAEELRLLVEIQAEEGFLARVESDFLQGVVELVEIRVREIMTPRVDIVSFDLRNGLDEFLSLSQRSRKRRIPVHEGNVDELLGFLRTRDVLFAGRKADLRSLIRKPYYVPEAMTAVTLLKELGNRNDTVAVVVDEYGGTAGLVSVEDTVEEIVGDIVDDFDRNVPMVRRLGASDSASVRYVVEGALSSRDSHELFGTGAPRPDAPTTLAGLLAAHLGRVLRPGDQATIGAAGVTVTRVERGRVRELVVEPGSAPDHAGAAAHEAAEGGMP